MTLKNPTRNVRAWLTGWRDCKRGNAPKVHTHPDYVVGYGACYTFESVKSGRTYQ